MPPDFVVDVGNTRIKWGRCAPNKVDDIVALPLVDPAAWQAQLERWAVKPGHVWAVTGVHPERRDFLANWLIEHGQKVRLIQLAQQLPLSMKVERPDQVGIDRLLNAVAVNQRRKTGESAIVVDAGSAATVDWIDADGVFRGGAIMPGFRTMGQSLNNYTALLPLVEIANPKPSIPGTSTRSAIEAGVVCAVAGGVRMFVERIRAEMNVQGEVYVTGGDGALLGAALNVPIILWLEMTLEGIRTAAS